MHARIIKPTFFTNEILGAMDPLTRLLFEGLWCASDREGRLEYRPGRLKVEVLPFDVGYDLSKGLTDLEAAGFLTFYEVGSSKFIQVNSFKKHQRPHKREAVSTIPDLGRAKALPRPDQGIAKDEPRIDQGEAEDNPRPNLGDAEARPRPNQGARSKGSPKSIGSLKTTTADDAPPHRRRVRKSETKDLSSLGYNPEHFVTVPPRDGGPIIPFVLLDPDGMLWPTAAYLEMLAGKFPGIDVPVEVMLAGAWTEDERKRTRRPTASGVHRFILNWLARAGKGNGRGMAPTMPPPARLRGPGGVDSPVPDGETAPADVSGLDPDDPANFAALDEADRTRDAAAFAPYEAPYRPPRREKGPYNGLADPVLGFLLPQIVENAPLSTIPDWIFLEKTVRELWNGRFRPENGGDGFDAMCAALGSIPEMWSDILASPREEWPEGFERPQASGPFALVFVRNMTRGDAAEAPTQPAL